jgi:hypothetical protein
MVDAPVLAHAAEILHQARSMPRSPIDPDGRILDEGAERM